MKTLFFLILGFFVSVQEYALQLQWTRQISNYSIIGTICESDMIYLLNNPVLSFANSSPGFIDHFLIKQDLNPNPQNWIQRSEGSLNEVASKMTRTPNGNIFYTGFFDMECILGQAWLSSDDQDSYIARVIDVQVTGNFAKPNQSNGAGSKSVDNSLIKVYPNPCSELLTIQSDFLSIDSQSEIFIRDITGRSILTFLNDENGSGQVTINTRLLTTGIYFLVIKNITGIHVVKFLKTN